MFSSEYLGFLRKPSVRESNPHSERRNLTHFVSKLDETLSLNFSSENDFDWAVVVCWYSDWGTCLTDIPGVVWGVHWFWPLVIRSRNRFICASDIGSIGLTGLFVACGCMWGGISDFACGIVWQHYFSIIWGRHYFHFLSELATMMTI